jgi:hypothetical protein
VRAGVEVDVSHGETDELGGTQPGLGGEHEHRPVAPSGPGRDVAALISASVSSTVKNVISVLPCRLGGIARTLRRIVTHRVYLGVAYHGKHVQPDAHPALIDRMLFEAANRVLPGAPPPRAGRVNVIGGSPGALGAPTSSSRSSPAPATIAGSAARC